MKIKMSLGITTENLSNNTQQSYLEIETYSSLDILNKDTIKLGDTKIKCGKILSILIKDVVDVK